MAQWVSFRDVRERVGIEQVLEHYGLLDGMQRKGNELLGLCPFHHERKPSFKANTQKNAFKCFGCNAGGNVFAFVKRMEDIDTGDVNRDDRQAALLLAEWFGITSARPMADTETVQEQPVAVEDEQAREEEREEGINPPLAFTLTLDPEHPYLVERGLAPETIEHFGIGYCGRGMMRGRIAIPIYNECGELVAYAGRWPGDPPDGEPKYKVPPKFHKSQVVYNLHRAREFAEAQGLILVEGFFDVMRLWQVGKRNAVAIMGSALSPAQEVLLVSAVGPEGRVTLMFDDDDAGRACTEDALARLSRKVFVCVEALQAP